jgi:hypothetical protein
MPSVQRFDTLKRVADTSLFVTGVFVDCLDRGLVGADYYTALGRNAYAQLSNEMRRGGLGDSFVELADRFPDFVRVLGAISALELFNRAGRDPALQALAPDGSAREADLLVRRGLIPVPPPTRRQ